MDDVTRDALDDHRHDPPGDWDELSARRGPAMGRSYDRQVLDAVEARRDRSEDGEPF